MLKKILRMKSGFSFLEIIVSIVVLATFGTIMLSTVLAGQDSTKRTDTTMFFDNRNLNATSVFKTNPSIEYLKTRFPFDEMEYNETTKVFTQYFDERLGTVESSDSNAVYKSEYTVDIADAQRESFRYENKKIKLELRNYQMNAGTNTYELLKNSAAKGSIGVHANVLEEGKVTSPTSPENPSDPTQPTQPTPTDPTVDNEYAYVEFTIIGGGIFGDTQQTTLTKRVKKGSLLGDKINLDGINKKPIMPIEGEDFNPTTLGAVFSGWKNPDGTDAKQDQSVNSNLKLTGTYAAEVYFDITFVITEGGKFNGTGTSQMTRKVKEGSRLGDQVNVGGSIMGPIIPVEGVDFKANDEGDHFSGWKNASGDAIRPEQLVTSSFTVQGTYAAVSNPVIEANIDITDRNFWDGSTSTLGFLDEGGKTYVTAAEKTINGIPAHDPAIRKYSGLESTSELKNKIIKKGSPVTVQLNITYNLVNVKKIFTDTPGLQLKYNNSIIPIDSRFNGGGAVFEVLDITKNQLANILGMNPELVTVNVTLIPKEVPYNAGTSGRAGKYGAYLKADISPNNRFVGEKFRIKLVKDLNQSGMYQVQIIGENGENIMDPNREAGRPWLSAIHVSNVNFNIGGQNVTEVHELTLFVRDFKIQFADDPNYPGTDLKIHHVRPVYYYKSPNFTAPAQDTPDLPRGSQEKAYLQIYGSIDSMGVASNVKWLDRVNSWGDYTDDGRGLTGLVGDCPNYALASVPLPNGYTATKN